MFYSPSFVRPSDEYFSTLREHAVPLDHRAVAAIQHNALMLDVYKRLAQRLCRQRTAPPSSSGRLCRRNLGKDTHASGRSAQPSSPKQNLEPQMDTDKHR